MAGNTAATDPIDAAARLMPTPYLPVAPYIIGFAARCAGMTQADIYSDPGKWLMALESTFRAVGKPDAVFSLWPRDAARAQMLRVLIPGEDLPPDESLQFIEAETMRREDYDAILKAGYASWFFDYWRRVRTDLPKGIRGRAVTIGGFMRQGLRIRRMARHWERRGIAPLFTAACYPPFDLFSLLRSLEPFCFDLSDCGDRVEEACAAALPDIIRMASIPLRVTGGKRVCIYPMRSSASFISPEAFRRFSFPFLKTLVETFFRAGIVSILHCDGNWSPMLPFFRELPRASCIVELDGCTDIIRAKELLGGHLCLKGDVPASLLAFGEPDEVADYCARLRGRIGIGGGFILSSGCEVPVNAKPQNVAAMMRAAR